MPILPSSYYKILAERGGQGISAHIGGVGIEACEDLKQPLIDIFKAWRATWAKQGLLPKRKSKNPSL
jgi:hypothetical protein